jgi:hypothetical protein
MIVRASVALSGTKYYDKRAFAIAVKIFPSIDRSKPVDTLNYFVMETIAGKRKKYFLETVFDNAPSFGGLPTFGEWGMALRLQSDFKSADRELSPADPDLAFRPINHLAVITGDSSEQTISPKWLRMRIADGTQLNEEVDFRNELSLDASPGDQLTWEIDVVDDNKRGKSSSEWRNIARLVLTESITSNACDAKLHFPHPILE